MGLRLLFACPLKVGLCPYAKARDGVATYHAHLP